MTEERTLKRAATPRRDERRARSVKVWDLFAGRAFAGNAVLRYTNTVLILLHIAWVIAFVFVNIKWFNYAAQLSDRQYLVYQVDANGETTIHQAGEFRTGPTDPEIRNTAWKVVSRYWEAGTKNYEIYLAEAREMMTSEMQEQFDQAKDARIDELQRLNIYRKIEGAHVRPLNEDDLPAGTHIEITRYDVVVEGRLDTYREGSRDGERISTGPIAVYVHLAPLPNRTDRIPTALQVAGMMMLDSKTKSGGTVETGAQQKNSPTPVGK